MKKETAASWSDVHSRERRRRLLGVYSGLLILAFIIFVAVLWVIIYSPLFRVKNIEVSGNKNIASEDIITLAKAEILSDSFRKRVLGMDNILVWPKKLPADSLRFLPGLKSLSIEKSFGRRNIKIAVEEKKPFAAWCVHGLEHDANETETGVRLNCFWFDADGVIFDKSIGMEGNLISVVNDYSQKKIGLNSKILPDEFLPEALSIFRAISESGLSVKELRLNDLALEEMEADTYDGPKVYFSLRFPADNVPAVLKSLKEKIAFGSLQYVDFRIENRVYYK